MRAGSGNEIVQRMAKHELIVEFNKSNQIKRLYFKRVAHDSGEHWWPCGPVETCWMEMLYPFVWGITPSLVQITLTKG